MSERIDGMYRKNIDKHYVSFDLVQNTKSTLNDSIKVKMIILLTNACVIFFCHPEPFKASILSGNYCPIERTERGESVDQNIVR